MRKATVCGIVAGVLLWAAAGPAGADSITTLSGSGADSWANKEAADTNYGGDDLMQTNYRAAQRYRIMYVRFDLSSLGFDKSLVDTVELSLVYDHASAGAGYAPIKVYGLNDLDAGESWIETGASGLTWNNAPGRSGNGVDTSAAPELAEIPAVPSPGDPIAVSSAAMAEFLRNDTNGVVTFLLQDTTSDSDTFWRTKEYDVDSVPTLTITQRAPAIPEPLSLLGTVAGAGAVAGYVRRRRRA